MNDLKLFANTKKQLESLVHVTHTFSAAMGMQFGLQKCASVVLHCGKLCSSSGLILPDGISALSPLEYCKYLGIYEADSPKTKDIAQTEYLRRLRKVKY